MSRSHNALDLPPFAAQVISMTEELLQELKQQQWQQQSNQHQPQQQHYATGSAVDDSSLAAAQQPQAAPYESTGEKVVTGGCDRQFSRLFGQRLFTYLYRSTSSLYQSDLEIVRAAFLHR